MKLNTKLFAIIIVIISCGFTAADIAWLPKSGKKKLEKTIIKLFKDEIITKKEVILSKEKQEDLKLKLHPQTVYSLHTDGTLKGYLLLDKASSKFDKFDYAVITNSKLQILKVVVLVYREDYGGEIASPAFVKQFKKKTVQSSLKYNDDIQGIAGATISGMALTKGVKKQLTKINRITSH